MTTPIERIRKGLTVEPYKKEKILADDIQYLELNAIFIGKTVPDYIRREQYDVAIRTLDNVIGVLRAVKRDIEIAQK